MDKKSLHHLWARRIRPIRTWYLLVACLVSLIGYGLSFRHNDLAMIQLREAVYQADKNGGDVEAALQQLRAHMHSHMRLELKTSSGVYPPIQLQHTYERLQKAEQARVNEANSKVYTDAQNECERMYPGSFSGGPRIPCIEKYVDDHGVKAKKIPDSLYKFDFVSPQWSPDLAGWLLLLAIASGVLTVVRFALGRILKSASH